MNRSIKFKKPYFFYILIIIYFVCGLIFLFHDLPYYYGDEFKVVDRSLTIFKHGVNFFEWPPLLNYINGIVFGIIFAIGKILKIFSNTQDFIKYYVLHPIFFYKIARLVNVILGLIGFWYFLNILKILFKREKFIIYGGLLFIFSYILQMNLHVAILDVPLLTMLLIILYYSINRKKFSFFKIAILVGIAGMVKYNGFAFYLIPISVLLEQLFNKEITIKEFLITFIKGLLIIFVVVIVINPFIFIHWKKFLKDFFWQFNYVAIDNSVKPNFLKILKGIFFSFGLLGIIIALYQMIKQILNKKFLLSLFPFIYFLYILTWHRIYLRYFLPLLPFIIILFLDFIRKIKYEKLILGINLVNILFFTTIYFINISQPSTTYQASEWIKKHIKSNQTIVYTKKTVYLLPNEKLLKLQLDFRKKKGYSGLRWQILLDNQRYIGQNYNLIFLNCPKENEFVWECDNIKYAFDKGTYFVILQKYDNIQLKQFSKIVKKKAHLVKKFYNKFNKKAIYIYEK